MTKALINIKHRQTFDEIKENRNRKMKVASSLKTLKNRSKDCKIVRRKGRVFVINKKNPKFKAVQG